MQPRSLPGSLTTSRRPASAAQTNGETSTNRPATAICTETIQQYLEENHALIKAILDATNRNQSEDCARYQQKLQRNLMYLAAIADAQPQPPSQTQQTNSGISSRAPTPTATESNPNLS